ncbi:MAG: hypothetical protein K9K78_01770, partial [Spirochaetales bacterium]|nr:hypothetical protein [Spirochaetales bacterium]
MLLRSFSEDTTEGTYTGNALRKALSDFSRIAGKKLSVPAAASIILFLLFCASPLVGEEFNFSQISLEDGLSSNSVYCVYQDSRGFMWFGTFSGLNRYDGSSLKRYKPVAEAPESISGSLIFDIFEDSKKHLWIGTDGGGLNLYHPESDSFSHYRHHQDEPLSLSSDKVFSIYEDDRENIWVGTAGGGLNRYDTELEGFIHYPKDSEEAFRLEGDIIRSIMQDSRGRLWIGTEGGGLSRYRYETDDFITYRASDRAADKGEDRETGSSENKLGKIGFDSEEIGQKDAGQDQGSGDRGAGSALVSDVVRCLFEDSHGNVWVGTDAGLDRYDSDIDGFIHYLPLKDEFIRTINEDERGRIWVGTEDNGIFIIDSYGSGGLVHITYEEFSERSISSDNIRHIYNSRDGLIWIASKGGGLNLYNPNSSVFSHYHKNAERGLKLSDNNIRQIYEDSRKNIWVATDGGGINRISENGELTEFHHDPLNVQSLSSDQVYSVVEDDFGDMWIGTDGEGLNRYDPAAGEWTRFSHDPEDPSSISSNVVWALFADTDGRLWVGTEGGGLDVYDHREDRFYRYSELVKVVGGIMGNSIRYITEDREGILWVASWDGGLSRIDLDTMELFTYERDPNDRRSLGDNSVNAVLEDAAGRLWVGTSGAGLDLFDREKKTFSHFTREDGLPGENVFGLVEDDQGYIWISTNKGLAKMDPEKRDFIRYGQVDGLQKDEFSRNAFLKSSKGELFFGGPNGMNSFYPEAVKEPEIVPDIVVTRVSITNRDSTQREVILPEFGKAQSSLRGLSWDSSSGSLSSSSYSSPNEVSEKEKSRQDGIILEPGDLMATFHFSVLSFTAPGMNQYAVKLFGFQQEWSYLGNNGKVTYTSLPPGTYRLNIIASNSNGIWNKEGLSIPVEVLPYYWQTPVFWFFMALLLFSLITLFFYVRTRNLRRRNAMYREFGTHIQNAREEERSIIARDVHDELGQLLTVMKMDAYWLQKHPEGSVSDREEKSSGLVDLLNQSLESVKALSSRIRPRALDHLTIAEAIKWQLQEFEKHSEISCSFKQYGSIPKLPEKKAAAVYRIFQEGMTNISRHSQAAHVEVTLTRGLGMLVLVILDDGVGIKPSQLKSNRSFGLLGMKERSSFIQADLKITVSE